MQPRKCNNECSHVNAIITQKITSYSYDEVYSCGSNVSNLCAACHTTVGLTSRLCDARTQPGVWSGTDGNATCTRRFCPQLPTPSLGGWWEISNPANYSHYLAYRNKVDPSLGYNVTLGAPPWDRINGTCGSIAVLKCPPYHQMFVNGSEVTSHSRNCAAGYNWDASVSVECKPVKCTETKAANWMDASGSQNQMAMVKSFYYGAAGPISVGDTNTFVCTICGGFNITTYPNPRLRTITRVCQPDGMWSGTTAFDCLPPSLNAFIPGMLAEVKNS